MSDLTAGFGAERSGRSDSRPWGTRFYVPAALWRQRVFSSRALPGSNRLTTQGVTDELEVGDESFEGLLALVAGAQDGGGVDRHCCQGGAVRFEELAAIFHHFHLRAEEGTCGGGAEGDDSLRADRGDLGLEPRPAGVHLADPGGLVQAPLAL